MTGDIGVKTPVKVPSNMARGEFSSIQTRSVSLNFMNVQLFGEAAAPGQISVANADPMRGTEGHG